MSPTPRTAPAADDLGMGDRALAAAPAEPATLLDGGTVSPSVDESDGEDEVVVTRNRPRVLPRLSEMALFRGALIVLVLAMVVLSAFTLISTNQLRDQYTIANGLQRCLITAQLNENSTTDTTGAVYKAAVQACLSK